MIKITDFRKSFGKKEVHRGVDLYVPEGKTHVVIGTSGVGKSVLLKCISGIMKADGGQISVDGQDITKLNDQERYRINQKMGYLFQGAALFDSMTIEDNVSFALRYFTRYKSKQIKEIVVEKLRLVGLDSSVLNKKPLELSSGMQKRVGLARAIAMDPKIILYDEPTTGLDPIMSEVIDDLIIHLQQELKVTGIVVTHDMNSAFRVGNKIAMLFNGKIIHYDEPEQTRTSDDPIIQQFIRGDSEGPFESRY